MRILGIDLSTHCGFAILDSETGLVKYGVMHLQDMEAPAVGADYAPDFQFVLDAQCMAHAVTPLLSEFSIDYIAIEQTNNGKNRISQKRLEMLHYALLEKLYNSGRGKKVHYIDTSKWRRVLGIRLSKEQRKHNLEVRARIKTGGRSKAGEGKITTKHLSVGYANEKYHLNLKVCDNDSADAICLCDCLLKMLKDPKPITTAIEIDKIVALAKTK